MQARELVRPSVQAPIQASAQAPSVVRTSELNRRRWVDGGVRIHYCRSWLITYYTYTPTLHIPLLYLYPYSTYTPTLPNPYSTYIYPG